MTELINETFNSGSPSDDFDGTGSYGPSYSAGILVLDAAAEGAMLHKTDMGSGDWWAKFQATALPTTGRLQFPVNGDSSGNFYSVYFIVSAGNLNAGYSAHYTTYTTYVNEDVTDATNIGTWTDDDYIGITYDRSTNVVSIWHNPTAATPTDVDTWDSASADVTTDLATEWAGFTEYGNRVGFGSTSSGDDGERIDNFTAGNFEVGSTPLATRIEVEYNRD